jgi:hypothetical protein
MYRYSSRFFSKAATGLATSGEPPRKLLWYHLLISGIPMIGFGFIDNTIMLRAGDLIDNTVGNSFKLHPLTAAGIGQAISDTGGILFGSSIAVLARRLGLKAANFSESHKDMRVVRRFGIAGSAIGVFLGCSLGMANLLFMDVGASERKRRTRELHTIFETVVHSSSDIICAKYATIWVMSDDGTELWTPAGTGLEGKVLRKIMASDKGLTVTCCKNRASLNVSDCYEDERFDSGLDKEHGLKTKSMLCIPIFSKGQTDRQVIGVLQFINKVDETGKIGRFSDADEKLGKMLAHHVAIFISQSNNSK